MFVKKLQGCEEIIANDGCRLREVLHPDRDGVDVPYSLAMAWVDPGQATLPHRLQDQTELYSIVRGRGRMHIGAESTEVEEGDSILVPRASVQWIENTGVEVLQFTCLVSPPWKPEDDVRVDADSA